MSLEEAIFHIDEYLAQSVVRRIDIFYLRSVGAAYEDGVSECKVLLSGGDEPETVISVGLTECLQSLGERLKLKKLAALKVREQ